MRTDDWSFATFEFYFNLICSQFASAPYKNSVKTEVQYILQFTPKYDKGFNSQVMT